MAEVASLSVRIGADITGLIGGLKQSEGALAAFGSKIGGGVAALAKIGIAAAAAGAALTAHLVKNSMDAIGAQADLAKALGTTSASLSVLQRAGELAGVEFQTIQNAGQKLAINLGKASEAGSAQADTLKRLAARR
jgi:DNA-binding Xre family transcriptional regulator